jgi:hypothetical protein
VKRIRGVSALFIGGSVSLWVVGGGEFKTCAFIGRWSWLG